MTLITLPGVSFDDAAVAATFREKYPAARMDVAHPEGSSADEEDAVQTLAGHSDQPDNVDVSAAVADDMVKKGLFEPYTPTLSRDIPARLQDPDHHWVAGDYGVIVIATNSSIVPHPPRTFADLKKPEYRGLVALAGDPRRSDAAFAGVMAAALANGGSADDIMPGIQFFADLKALGNLSGTDVSEATVVSGQTPIAIDWSSNMPRLRQELQDAGLTMQVAFPADGMYGGFYARGVVKGSPHQACSKLWLEHILSDDGALGYLAAGEIPARYQSLVNAGKITDAMKANLPPEDLMSQITFLTAAQFANAKEVVAENWGPMVADAG